jgi:decaprenyl-phosphate phosphoribosyltransferase
MAYIRLIRPHHWVKNLLIIAPAFFAGVISDTNILVDVLITFLLFSIVSGGMYAINDVFDKTRDSAHSKKRNRPVASGAIRDKTALIYATILLLSSLGLSAYLIPDIAPWLLLYFLFNLLYSKKLKYVPVLDIMIFPLFYLIRIIVGGVAADVVISEWLILCTIFLSIFLVVAKRYVEFLNGELREVLKFYSHNFLQSLLIVSASLCVMSFAIYSVLGNLHYLAVYSNLFVLAGMFRYFYIVYSSDAAEAPEVVLIKDGWLASIVVLWVGYLFIIFYLLI